MDHSAVLVQTRTNVLLLRKEGIMSSNEATTILDIIAMIVSRIHGGTTALAEPTNTTDAVNVLSTHFPFKAHAVKEHEKASSNNSGPPELMFVSTMQILITGEYDSKYWLGSLRDGRFGKVPKEKVERLEKVETTLSYRAETPTISDLLPAYTVTADDTPKTSAPPEVPTVSTTIESSRTAVAPLAGYSTGPSLNPPFEAVGPALDRDPALNRNTTLPPRPNRNSRPDMDLRRVNTAQIRRPSPQPVPSPSSQQFNQRFSQLMEPKSPSFAPATYRRDLIQPLQPYGQPPFGQRPSAPKSHNHPYQQSMAPVPSGPASSSYSQAPYPTDGESSMPVPSVPGRYYIPEPSGYYPG